MAGAIESESEFVFPFLAEVSERDDEEPARRSTRDALLEAAASAFGESGFSGVSIRDVERRAGVNRGLVAHHFGTKDGLWYATVDWLMGAFAAELERYREFLGLLPRSERPRILMKVYIRFAQKHPQYFRLILVEGDKPSERARQLRERYARPLEEFWQRATGVDSGLPADSHAIRHFILFGAGSVIFATPEYCKQMFGIDPNDPQFAERYADVVAEMWVRISDLVEA
jgi:TetR/AcrR family transcriptional regulator